VCVAECSRSNWNAWRLGLGAAARGVIGLRSTLGISHGRWYVASVVLGGGGLACQPWACPPVDGRGDEELEELRL
jgi:hypothetical protein